MNWIPTIPFELRLAALFLFGVCLGSLLNLGIYRLAYQPRPISPWSAAAPGALRRRWSDRLPLWGWLGLRRESSLHGPGFWMRPLALELFTGALIAALYWWEIGERGLLAPALARFLALPQNQPALHAALVTLHCVFLAHVCLIGLMIVASFIDLDEKTIPDSVTIPGTLIGLLFAAWLPRSLLPVEILPTFVQPNPRLDFLRFVNTGIWHWTSVSSLALGIGCVWLWSFGLMTRVWRMRRGWRIALRLFFLRWARDPMTKWLAGLGLLETLGVVWVWRGGGTHWQALLTALVGMAIGGGLIWVVRIVGTLILRREAMGFGDVTLMAMIGAFLGWQPCLVIFFLAPFAGAAIGIAQWLTNRDPEIRYGPFLCLAALVTIVRWADVWEKIGPLFAIGWLIPATLAACLLVMGPLLVIVRAIGDRLRGE